MMTRRDFAKLGLAVCAMPGAVMTALGSVRQPISAGGGCFTQLPVATGPNWVYRTVVLSRGEVEKLYPRRGWKFPEVS